MNSTRTSPTRQSRNGLVVWLVSGLELPLMVIARIHSVSAGTTVSALRRL